MYSRAVWSLRLHNSCCSRCLIWCARESRLGQSLQGSGVSSRVCSYVGVVDDKCVDVVVRYDVGHNLLIFLRPLNLSPTLLFRASTCRLRQLLRVTISTTSIIIAARGLICIFTASSSRARSCPFLVALEDNLCAFVSIMLQRFRQHLSLALLLRLVIEIQNLGCFSRLSWFLGVWRSQALSLQGLPIGVLVKRCSLFGV